MVTGSFQSFNIANWTETSEESKTTNPNFLFCILSLVVVSISVLFEDVFLYVETITLNP